MSKITENNVIFFRLIQRSKDLGDGWRQVSDVLWRYALEQHHEELTELDHENKRIRFTPEGEIIARFAL